MQLLKKFVFLSLFICFPLMSSEQLACACDHDASPDTPGLVIELKKAPEKVVRAAIDIGSGATKLRVAEVNLKTHKIEKILVNESFAVQYQEKLSKSPNNTFDQEVMNTGIEAMRKSVEIASKYNAQKVIAVATASFRKAANSQELIDTIYKETGVRVFVVDQELEGKLAFNGVLSQGNYNVDNLIVWDIGGGSLQLTALDKDGSYDIYRGEIASIHFKDIMIKDVQHKNVLEVTTPNPIAPQEIEQGVTKAQEIASTVGADFKARLNRPGTQIVGVGNIFAYGIYPAVGKKSPFTLQELQQALMSMANKDDQQVGGGDYANVQVSNTILIKGYMDALNIQTMDILDVNNADGAMLYSEFWQ